MRCGSERCSSLLISSGCLCMLGISPKATALLIARDSLRWLTGRKPVSERGRILPRSVTYSDMTEKFCSTLVNTVRLILCSISHLVQIHGVLGQHIKYIGCWRCALLPFASFGSTQIVWCIYIANFPFTEEVAFHCFDLGVLSRYATALSRSESCAAH